MYFKMRSVCNVYKLYVHEGLIKTHVCTCKCYIVRNRSCGVSHLNGESTHREYTYLRFQSSLNCIVTSSKQLL